MANTDFKSVDEYIASRSKDSHGVLEQVREAIRKAIPKAVEVISYQIPSYKMPGGAVIFFAGWKKHYSVYPATSRVLEEFEKELADHEVKQSTIRFSLTKPVPVRLIQRIAKFRAKEIAELQKSKSTTSKKRSPK